MNGSVNPSDLFNAISQANILTIILILAGSWLLISLSERCIPWFAEKAPSRFRFSILSLVPLLRLGIIAGALTLIVTSVIEPTVENLLVLVGALGLGLGFAFKDYISSLLAGVVTLYEAPYRPGDWIEIDGAYGEVKAINMRSVEIVTPDDTVVIIPHMNLWNKFIFNANDGGQNLQCTADFYLHPRHDAEHVVSILEDVALTSAYLQIKQPIKIVLVEKPWGTHYRLKAYPVDPRQQFAFVSDLTIRGKAALQTLGITFAAVLPPSSLAD
ncbi:mechanosensitive ion channel family protein [Desulfosediminicola flagellatus]|uniref:mechanosensitive ion channel family protein n=1 Tax=Desulfosediminicola flagellatus TaxID=2569541 RepID=UPI0010ACA5B5|nr:mechanosensitive ion channel domain-containing protein [Desulfosediminicola flagellatus]